MTNKGRWIVLGVLAVLYLLTIGVLVGTMTERFRFDAVRAGILTQLNEATRRGRAAAMERELELHPPLAPAASPDTEIERRPRAWRGYIEMADAAVARRDESTALRAWREAYAAARLTRTWRPLAEVGDALLRIGAIDGRRAGYIAQARETYMAALIRARADRSVDGVLHVAEAFSSLGDHAVAEQCLAVAERLGASADHEVIVRIRALRRAADAGTAPRFEP